MEISLKIYVIFMFLYIQRSQASLCNATIRWWLDPPPTRQIGWQILQIPVQKAITNSRSSRKVKMKKQAKLNTKRNIERKGPHMHRRARKNSSWFWQTLITKMVPIAPYLLWASGVMKGKVRNQLQEARENHKLIEGKFLKS